MFFSIYVHYGSLYEAKQVTNIASIPVYIFSLGLSTCAGRISLEPTSQFMTASPHTAVQSPQAAELADVSRASK